MPKLQVSTVDEAVQHMISWRNRGEGDFPVKVRPPESLGFTLVDTMDSLVSAVQDSISESPKKVAVISWSE